MNDLDLIERLRAAGAQAPAARHTPDAVLAAGRRAAARRNVLRISGATLGLAVAVLAGSTLTSGSGTQVVTAAGDGAPGDESPVPPRSAAELNPDADRVNAAILQAALGNDFDVMDDVASGTLRAGSESAAGLPTAYDGTVTLVAAISGKEALAKQCVPLKEKGSFFEACVARTLPDGREVQARFSHWAPTGEYPQATAGEGVRVLFLQPDNTLAYVDLVTSADADESTAATAEAAHTWLDSMVDRLGAAAADPDVQPVAVDGDVEDAKKPAVEVDEDPKKDPTSDPAAEKAAIAKKAAMAKEDDMAKPADKEAMAPSDEAAAAKKAGAAQEAKQAATPEDDAAAAKAAAAKRAAAAAEAEAGEDAPPVGQ